MRFSSLIVILSISLSLFHTALAYEWSIYDTPFHNANGTAGPVSYTPDCTLCGSTCVGDGSCCGGYITNATEYSEFMCRSQCMPIDQVCCGCNDPIPGQVADPNILCVTCPKADQCYYNPSNQTNIRYYCVSYANNLQLSYLMALSLASFVIIAWIF